MPPSPRRISDAGLDLIKRWEGCRLQAYQCPAGVWTVGYGSTRGVTEGTSITQAEADERLRQDVAVAEDAVQRLIDVPLNDNQFASLCSFTLNLGQGALANSTLRIRLNDGHYSDVPTQMMRFVKAAGKVEPGLVSRRAAEAKLWSS